MQPGDVVAVSPRSTVAASSCPSGLVVSVDADLQAICGDCGDETRPHEIYVVRDDAWPVVEPVGLLCIGCLEIRLSRRLTPADFPDMPVNDSRPWDSERLRSRKGPGRLSDARYEAAVVYVVDGAWSIDAAAAEWDVHPVGLRARVDEALVNTPFLAEDS